MLKKSMTYIACLHLVSCGGGLPTAASYDATATQITEVTGRDAARAYTLQSCPLQDAEPAAHGPNRQFAALAAALIPVAVDFGFRLFGDYLKRVQSERTANYLATGTGNLSHSCLVVVRGNFGPTRTDIPSHSGILSVGILGQLGLTTYPSMYMEASIQRSGSSQYIVEPRALQYAKTAALRRGDGRKQLGMVIAFRTTPVVKPDQVSITKDAAATIPFDFGIVQEGSAVRSGGMSLNTQTDVFADQARAVSVAADKTGSIDIYALVVETGETDRVLSLMSDTFEANKSDLQKAFTAAIGDALRNGGKEKIAKE